MEEQTPTRAEIRAISADPESTPRQVLEAKLVLARRITGHEDAIRQVCERYRLTPEQTEAMLTRRAPYFVRIEALAAEHARRIEQELKELKGSD